MGDATYIRNRTTIATTQSQTAKLGDSIKQFQGIDPQQGVSIILEGEKGLELGGNDEILSLTYQREGIDSIEQKVDTEMKKIEKIDLMNCDTMVFKLLTYQENTNHSVRLRFHYSFTQNQGLENEAVHTKSIDHAINLRAVCPFRIDWSIRSENPFLDCLKDELENLRKNEEWKQKLTHNSLSDKLKSNMLAVQGQDCWLVAKLTSVADCDLKINLIDLHVNPNFTSQVQRKTQDAQEREHYIRPGESVETVFRMKVGKFDLNKPQKPTGALPQ